MKTINVNHWNQNEIDFLRKDSYNYTLEELSLKLNRSLTSIRSQLAKMKIKAKLGVYRTCKWTQYEIDYIKNNHLNITSSQLAVHLNRSIRGITELKSNLGLNIKDNSDILLDFKRPSPELAYTIGFSFADGCLHRFASKSGGLGKLLLQVHQSDGCYLEPVLLKTSNKWSCIDYTYKDTTKRKIARFTLSDTPTYEFMYNDLELKYKNEFFSQKIFDFLPENLHHYFWRGYFDGDGCVSDIRYKLAINCCFSGPVNMDWSVLVKLLDNLGIKSHLGKSDNLNSKNRIRGRWSNCNIRSSFDTVKFMQYIYKDFPKDNIGFTRKFIRYVRYLERRAISPYYSRMVKNADLLGV